MTRRKRLIRFGVAVVVTIAVVAWMGRATWRELHRLRTNFAAVGGEGFHLSDYIQEPIRTMDEALLQQDAHRDAESQARFLTEGAALRSWLQRHTNSVMSPDVNRVMGQIQEALEVYLARGQRLIQTHAVPEGTTVLDYVESNSAPLQELCDKLAGCERVALQQFILDSHGSLAWLQGLMLVFLVLLMGLGTWIGLSGYRELLVPLRSQLRQSQAVLERHEKLASLGTLAAGVAHEIRNPLTAINVRIHSLKRDLVPGSSEHEDATVIDSEIKRLEGIVQAFLQFARPTEPKLVTTSADSLLTRAQKLLAGQLEKAAIRLEVEWLAGVWVRVDPQQIEQVLINLVQNAAESIESDGEIRLRARRANAPLGGRTQPVVLLEVSDTGTGIPPEVQKRLFDPFFTTKEGGTGLGLSIAARILEQQGGALQFVTELNRGTTFSIVLPEAEAPTNEPTSDNPAHRG